MAKFAVYTVAHEGFTAHHFKPGDEVPEWALDQVGDHVLEAEAVADADTADEADAADETDESNQDQGDDGGADADGEDNTPPPADDQPDFTAPAPARRRGRAQK